MKKDFRAQVAEWLASGEIDLFIGYERSPLGLHATPAFIRRPEDAQRLIWDATCENNLAVFLPNYPEQKVGIMVKGCDSRAIVGLMQEGQVARENLRIVGAHCPGVMDPRRVARELEVAVEDLEDAYIEDGEIVLGETRLPVDAYLYEMCETCRQHNPVLCDVAVGEPIPDEEGEDPFAHVRQMEALPPEARWARFAGEMERCNLCYACRNVCPLCYCNTCFADSTEPRWFNETTRPEDVQFFQIMRTFHLAGRCVGCGACTRACPQGVDIRLLLDKLCKDVEELYDYQAGRDPGAQPPLRTYSEEDYDEFVL